MADLSSESTTTFSNVSVCVYRTAPPHPSQVAFSDELVHYTSVINVVGTCTVVSVFGIFGNIVNMIILYRMGFKETVNITLFATAISDLMVVMTTLWVAICYNPLFLSADLPFLPQEIQLPTGAILHVMAVNVTSWLTAIVTFERCICITFPLKVKDIVTSSRTKAAVTFIFVLVVASQIPKFLINRIGWKFDDGRNKSVLGLVIDEKYIMVNAVSIYIVNVLGPFLSFGIIVICSIILVAKLSQKRKWRQQNVAKSGKEEVLGNRDRKVMKMVLMIAIIFIVCVTPGMVIFILAAENPEMTPAGSLANNYNVAVSFALLFEDINASVNIFVYYNMSSKYKRIFRYLFLRRPVDNEKGT